MLVFYAGCETIERRRKLEGTGREINKNVEISDDGTEKTIR